MLQPLTEQEFLAEGFNLADHQKESIQQAKQLAEEVSAFYPAEVIYSYHTEGAKGEARKKYYDNPLVHLMHPFLDIRVSRYKKTFSFFAWDLNELQNISTYDRQEASKAADQPQAVGVLTQKKVLAWVSYYEKVVTILRQENEKNKAGIQKFLDSIKDLPVRWNDELHTGGRIVRNGIEMTFKLETTYVSCKLEIYYKADNDLRTFLQLSDNKFVEPVLKPTF